MFTWLRKAPQIQNLTNTGQPIPLAKKDLDIILKIVQEFKDKSRKDVQAWVMSKAAVDNPNDPRWYLLQDMYDYLSPDGHLGSQKRLRRSATRCTPFMVRDKTSKKEITQLTDLLKDEWFFNLMGDFLDAIFSAYTAVQFTDPLSMNYKLIPRRNIEPLQRRIYLEVAGNKYIDVNDPLLANSMAFSRYGNEYGIMDEIVRDIIWKKNSRESWAEFSEKFGIPLISATTATRDKTEIARISKMLKEMGEAATAVLPTGSAITIHDSAAKGDPHQIYLAQVELANAEISKAILGGTMISDNGSSRSQSEVHDKNFTALLSEEDKIWLEFVINKQILPIARTRKINIPENCEFVFDRSEKLSLTQQWNVIGGMIDRGFEIPLQWLSERFGVPIASYTPKQATAQAQSNFNKPTNKSMAALLVGKNVMLPNYKISSCAGFAYPVAGFTENVLADLADELINNIFKGDATLAAEIARTVATYNHLLDGLAEGWGDRLGISYDQPDHKALALMDFNLFEFSRLKEKANVFALNELLKNDAGELRAESDFINQAQQYLKNPDINWLRTERNHAIAVAQNGSRYFQFMDERDDVTAYGIIQTVGDDRVRISHKLLDGKLINFNEPGGLKIWPPFDIGCRCEILQHLGKIEESEILSSTEIFNLIDKKPGDKWTGNRAEAGQIFAANEMYMKELNLGPEIKSLNYKSYGLKSMSEMQGLKPLVIDQTITEKNKKELFTPAKGKSKMQFSDYHKRVVTVDKKTFDKGDGQLFPHVADVLKNPDEVYFTNYKYNGDNPTFETTYIKHYEENSLVVNTSLNDVIEVTEWEAITPAQENKKRRGYLIKRKKPA